MGTDHEPEILDIYDLMDFEEVIDEEGDKAYLGDNESGDDDYSYDYDDYNLRQDYEQCYECY